MASNDALGTGGGGARRGKADEGWIPHAASDRGEKEHHAASSTAQFGYFFPCLFTKPPRPSFFLFFFLPRQGHTGSCRALAAHPSKPWFVTGGTDSVLRLWDARSRRQLSAARLLERVCSAAFHPAG